MEYQTKNPAGGRGFENEFGYQFENRHFNTTQNYKRLPPYGRQLHRRPTDRTSWPLLHGCSHKGVTLWLLCGQQAWEVAKRWQDLRLFAVLPDNDEPSSFDWRIMAGHDPVLIYRCGDVSNERVQSTITALFRSGVSRALLIGSGGIVYHRKEATHE